MKIVSAKQMQELEMLAFKEGASSLKFMQNAGISISKIIQRYKKKIIIAAGKGNNAGDAYVAASDLLKKNYNILVYQLFPITEGSALLKHQYNKFLKLKGKVKFIECIEDFKIEDDAIVLDGIFGTGFKGEIKGFLLDIINIINQSKSLKISIDIPSGLNGNTGFVNPIAIDSDITIFLGMPKIGFFINAGPNYIKKLEYVDFGLSEKYKSIAKEILVMEKINYKEYLPKIDKKRHKYQAGFVAGIAGSKGMFGAAKLSALGALRSGCGIVKLITEEEIDYNPLEIVNLIMKYKADHVLEIVNKADSVFIGPGLGRDKNVYAFLSDILPKIHIKTVLDADGLDFLANNLKCLLPKDCILTPHKKEMLKMLGLKDIVDEKELIKKCQNFSEEKRIVIVLKGYPTIIFHPEKTPLTIMAGDPGLATAGSGDVLTGMIASFLAQKLDIYKACVLAVHLHFLTAEIAARDKTSYSLIASDLIAYLPKAFKEVV